MNVEDDILITEDIYRLKPRHLDAKRVGYQHTTGFSSPANTHFKRAVDLNDLCLDNIDATYYMQMKTDSMIGLQISAGDKLIIDSEKEVIDGCVIVSWVEGGYRVRQVKLFDQVIVLYAAHKDYDPIYVHETMEFHYFGVVTYVIHALY